MSIQWVAGIITSLCISPRSWIGTTSTTHIHVWAAIILGGIITAFPVWLALTQPGKVVTRHVIAAGQILMAALLIHLTGGRIETHFHIFGSLAFLAIYRDWRVLITASLIVAADHGLRGVFWPQSVYGVLTVEPLRWVEHTGWVIFEDIFLCVSIAQSRREMWDIARRQAELEVTNQTIEEKVIERTRQLESEVEQRKATELALADRARELDTNVMALEQLSSQLEQSRDQAVRASRFKSEFLANMSHEIRTPLNAVVGMTDLLQRTNLSEEQREYCTIVNSSADALLGLINDILDYSKIEAGKLDLEIVQFDIFELLESAAELVAERARRKDLSLMTYVSPEIPRMVHGDPGRIRQVLLNFLSNSIKFTPCGEILIQATTISTNDNAQSSRVRFEVSDTGIGIKESSHDRLFHPFTQEDSSTTRKYGGTGLGLAISKRLVELMGGAISFHSVYGKGSSFSFDVELGHSAEEQVGFPKFPKEMEGMRVLLAAGTPQVQNVLQSYLSSSGLRVSTTTDLDKAMFMLRHEVHAGDPYTLVIVHHHAGSLDSLVTFGRDLRNNNSPALSKTRLILLSGSCGRELAQEALNEGYSGYLSVPIRYARLFDCILKLMQQRSDDTESNNESRVLEPVLPKPQQRNLVLVVEDNRVNQKVALLQLRDLGVPAHAVSNGLEAIEAVTLTTYSLIMMDCQMPEMDGFQATREIRKMEALTGKHSPIIAMTAHAMESDRIKCLEAGMDDFLTKPVGQQQLASTLSRWLPQESQLSDNEYQDNGGAEGSSNSGYRPIDLEMLYKTYGQKAAAEMVRNFMLDGELQIQQLSTALAGMDALALRDISHALKAKSATFYGTTLAERCCILEDCFRQPELEWEKLGVHVNSILQEWRRVKAVLEVALASEGLPVESSPKRKPHFGGEQKH